MSQEPLSPWVPAVVGIVIQGATAAFAWFKFFRDGSEKRTESVYELRDKLRSTEKSRDDEAYARLERENVRLLARVDDLESDKAEIARDRDRGWYLARWWEGYAHDIKHTFANLLFRANGRLELAKMETIPVPEIHWPTLEEPMPKPRESKPDV